ncbi:MAG: tetratricopeptide repeat protein [Gemmataceae bacterium]
MANSEFVFDVDEADFQTAVVERSRQVPVVVDFWAPWCGPCRALGPILERLVAQRNGAVLLAKLNVDENPNLAGYFQIEGIPAVKAIRDGRIVGQFEGVLPEAELDDFLNQVMPSEADRQIDEAAAKEKIDPAGAEAIYNQVLAGQPDHPAARLGLTRLRLAASDFATAERLLDGLPPGGEADQLRAQIELHRQPAGDDSALRRKVEADPENAAPRLELGRLLAANGHYPAALAMLYSAAERDRELARGPVKETMVQVFSIIGQRSDLAEEYRDKLQRVMY